MAGVIRTLSMCRRLSFRALAGGTEVPEPRGGPLPAAMSRLSQGFPITRNGRSRSRRSPPPPRWTPVPLDALERFAFRRRQATQRREAALTGSPSPTRVLRGGGGNRLSRLWDPQAAASAEQLSIIARREPPCARENWEGGRRQTPTRPNRLRCALPRLYIRPRSTPAVGSESTWPVQLVAIAMPPRHRLLTAIG